LVEKSDWKRPLESPREYQAVTSEYQAITSTEIVKIIKSLETKRSYFYDEISVEVLKISSPFVISPLTYITNKMFHWYFSR
jgi:hypothetical protein